MSMMLPPSLNLFYGFNATLRCSKCCQLWNTGGLQMEELDIKIWLETVYKIGWSIGKDKHGHLCPTCNPDHTPDEGDKP